MGNTILHVCESTVGGVGVVIRDFAVDQVARGYAPAVAVPDDGPLLDELVARGVRVFRWNVTAAPGPAVPGEIDRLRRIVGRVDPALVHLHAPKAGLAGRLLLRGRLPTVHQPHSWSFLARTGAIARATLGWERLAARWADVILCVSRDEERLGVEEGIQARYVVLPNGVNLETFGTPAVGDREAARASLELPDDPLAVCVGRLHRQKNQAALLDAWPAVRDRVPGARLALLGDGPDRDALAARGVEGVELRGQTDAVRTWLAAADVVAQPSRWEGLSLSVLEAQAAARSVVATDVPGMQELVDSSVGALVAPDDTEALAAAVALRLGDPARADGEGRAGRARIERDHDQRAQLDGVASLYDELLAAA